MITQAICHILLYYEEFQQIEDAIAREKELKGWSRSCLLYTSDAADD